MVLPALLYPLCAIDVDLKKVNLSKCLAKRGAQVALARTFGISAENHVGVGVGGGEDGPLGRAVHLGGKRHHFFFTTE